MRQHKDAGNMRAAVRHEVGALDKDLPLLDALSMTEQFGFLVRLAATVAGVAWIPGGAICICGVISISVGQPSPENWYSNGARRELLDILRLVIRKGPGFDAET